ncbi:MAG: hypothetical protein NTX88_08860 [Candidatus Atribacteria bacterium]|nr:hypothetical protein [Candidatus Atribacteria bacterium]
MKVTVLDIFRRDIHVVSSFATKKTMQYSINLLGSGKIKVKNFLSASFPLEDFGKGLHEIYDNPDHMKVQIVP